MAAVAKVSFVGDASSLKAAVAQSNAQLRELNNQAKASGQALASIDDAFGALAKGAAAVGGFAAVSAGLMSVVNAASAVQQSVGSVEAVFKGQAGEMLAAAKAAESLGLSQSEYSQTAAILGAQLKNLGVSQDQVAGKTQEMIRHAADMAAVFGTTVPEATDALGAALRGEYEQIEKYGISIKESAVQAEIAATGVGKAQAVVNLVMRQSQDVVGAAAKEADTWAVSSQKMAAAAENAKAKIGEGLLPIMSTIATAASTFASAASAIPAPIYTTVAAIGLLVVGKKALTAAIAKANVSLASYAAAQQIASVKSAQAGAAAAAAGGGFYALGAAAGSAAASTSLLGTAAGGAAGKVGTLVSAATAVGAVALAGAYAWGKFQDVMDDLSPTVDEITKSLTSVDEAKNWAAEMPGWLQAISDEIGPTISAVDGLSAAYGKASDSFRNILPGNTPEAAAGIKYLDAMKEKIKALGENNPVAARAYWDVLKAAMEEADTSAQLINDTYAEVEDSLGLVAAGADSAQQSFSDQAKAVDEARKATDELLKSVMALTDPFFRQQDATIEYNKAMQELAAGAVVSAAAVNAQRDGFDLSTEAGQKAAQSLQELSTATWAKIAADYQMGASQGELIGTMQAARDQFIAQAVAAGLSDEAAAKYADQLGLIPKNVPVLFTSNIDVEDGKAAEFKKRLESMPKTIPIQLAVYYAQLPPGWQGPLPVGVPRPGQQSAPPSVPSLSPFGGTTTSSMSSGVTSTGRTNLGRIMPEPVRPQVTVIVDPASGRARPLEDAWSPNLVGVG